MISSLEESKIPRHVAFIMDGNRRWAQKKKLPVIEGHKEGSKVIKKIVKKSLALKIKYLTFYGFSTENWKRDPTEISDLQGLLRYYLDTEMNTFQENNINFSVIGDRKGFGNTIIKKIKEFEENTRENSKLFFVLALGYGSRNEILKAINNLISMSKKNIREKEFNNYLMTKEIPDPDLVIRTSGEVRISNFLLWQIAYSELYFTKTLWPDFNSHKYEIALSPPPPIPSPTPPTP